MAVSSRSAQAMSSNRASIGTRGSGSGRRPVLASAFFLAAEASKAATADTADRGFQVGREYR